MAPLGIIHVAECPTAGSAGGPGNQVVPEDDGLGLSTLESERMLPSGLKYEFDALANKDFCYLTKTYLPRKLKEEDWLN